MFKKSQTVDDSWYHPSNDVHFAWYAPAPDVLCICYNKPEIKSWDRITLFPQTEHELNTEYIRTNDDMIG